MLKFNGENVVKGRFPNNEVDYSPLTYTMPIKGCNKFELIFESNEDLFNLMVVKKWFDDTMVEPTRCELIIKYFPYCQMDREMESHLFSLKYVAQIINELKFTVVEVYDPHSNVLPALLNRCRVIYPVAYPINVGNYDLYFYPDNGAAKVDLYVTHLKPESRKFYNSKGNGLIDNIYSADTLEMIQYFNMPEPRP